MMGLRSGARPQRGPGPGVGVRAPRPPPRGAQGGPGRGVRLHVPRRVHQPCPLLLQYVPEDLLPVYKDKVVPLADIITPNQFEAE